MLRSRQILAVVAVLVVMSGSFLYLEVSEITRAAWSESERDASYVAHALVWEIDLAARTPGLDSYQAVAESEDIARVLLTATQYAPTILYAAFVDTTGRAVAHSAPDLVGHPLEAHDPLPEISGFGTLWKLRPFLQDGEVYDLSIPLKRGRQDFGVVRVGVSATFLQSTIAPVLKRGMIVAGAQVFLGLLAAYLLSRIMFGPLRELSRGIQALRAGDFSYRVPSQAIDEFASMADALNELGERFSGASAVDHVMDHLGDGVLLVSPEREVTHINEPAALQLNLNPALAIGQQAHTLFETDHPVRRLMNEIFSGTTDRLSVQIEGSQGDALAVGHRVLRGAEIAGVLIEIKDLNFLGELQSVVAHHSAMTRLGEMAAGVAHEIRNPLGAIHLNLETLRDPGSLPADEMAKLLSTTRDQVTRLDRAVTGFLKVARLRELTLRPVNLGELSRSVVQTLEPEATMAGLELVLQVDQNLPRVDGDVEVLRQALVNLFKNALQAKPSSGDKVLVRVNAQSDKMVSIEIEDSGPGIPQDILPKVFDLYMTTKEGGTGVGLAFVRQAAEMHRGTVNVRSSAQGTTFTLNLRSESPVETARV